MGTCCGKEIITSKPGIRFTLIKDQVKPLDIIVFRGAEFVSDTISLLEKLKLGDGDWTHVGIVITPDIIPIKNSVPGKLYVWESTMSGELGDGVDNVETGKATFGVQIRDLEDVIDKYDNDKETKIGWGQLIDNPLVKSDKETIEAYLQRKSKISQILSNFDINTGNATYDYNCCDLCSTIYPKCSTYSKDIFGSNKRYFCSQLVAKILELVKMMPKAIDPEHVAPVDLLGNDGYKAVCKQPVVVTRNWPIATPVVPPVTPPAVSLVVVPLVTPAVSSSAPVTK